MRRLAALVAAGLVVGACTGDSGVEATAPSVGADAPGSTSTLPPVDDVAEGPDDALGYRWKFGDCVAVASFEDLPYEPYGSDVVVDCGGEHTFEVYFVGTFDAPDGTAYDEGGFSAIVRDACALRFIEFVGLPYPESGLDLVYYLPDAREWAAGLRYQACVVFDPRGGDDPPNSSGSLRGSAVPFGAVEGDCSNDLSLRGPLLECDVPHRYEHVGVFTPAESTWPGDGELEAAAIDGCRALADGYVAGGPAVPVGAVVGLPVVTPTRVDWDAGSRSVVCAAAAIDQTGERLVVIGSFAEDGWTIVGAAQTA
ncbi:MAG TPA: septum formation family protein [Acidimicrobiia bacterium]|nr:septum formation family protein [Acidimicrobiia bacterium]